MTMRIWVKRGGAVLMVLLLPIFVLGDLARNLWRLNRQAVRWTVSGARVKWRQVIDLHQELWRTKA